ncbi:MAG: hypothetical protein ACK4IY_08235 [Chitinophagales bacterium]
MKNLLAICFALIISVVFYSCDKNKDDNPTTDYTATITILEPEEGMVMNDGEELHVEVDFENDAVIHNLEILVLNETSGDTIMFFSEHVHADNLYQFHEHEHVHVMENSNCKVTALTWDEDKSQAITKSVHFTVNL